MKRLAQILSTGFLFVAVTLVDGPTIFAQTTWKRHTIDNEFQGADGVRLGDFDGDGLVDIVTGWEESGVIRLYLNPGPEKSKSRWPAVTVGKSGSPEDAVPFDFNNDGRLEIASCHEGSQRKVLVHQFKGNATKDELLKSSNWESSELLQLENQMWMFATPIRLSNSRRGLVLGSKGKNATLTLLMSEEGTTVEDWKHVKLRDCGWIMSIQAIDFDEDGDEDIVFSDRKSKSRGIGWLEQPRHPGSKWKEHFIGGSRLETMFIEATPGRVVAATRNRKWIDFTQSGTTWTSKAYPNPTDVPFGKAIKILNDETVVMTANTAIDKSNSRQPGVWLQKSNRNWQPIGSTLECKFDRIELIDLDGDGDRDLLTCEERKQLGVLWYENPGQKKLRAR